MIGRRSLSLRLLAFAGAAIAGALVLAWAVLGLLFERHVERQLQAELERHGLSLIAAMSLTPEGQPSLAARPFDPRFDRPASGLYWRITAPGGAVASRSLWDGALPEAAPPQRGWGRIEGAGPFEARVLTVVRDVQLDPGGPQVVIAISGDEAPLRTARAAFGFESGVFLAVLWMVLALAAWVQVRLGLAPLERVRNELEALRRAPDARLGEDGQPFEIRPLTRAVNDLADARAADIDRARHRARDLAHALKTPLTALRLQIGALDPDTARDLTHSLSLVSGAVEGELARIGAEGPGEGAPAAETLDRLIAVIARTPDGQRLTIDNAAPTDLRLPLSTEAALEVLGALLENAARFAASRIDITGSVDKETLRLTLDDDGPGIPAADRERVLQRGLRLDERADRHGLGLAIAADHIEASGGQLALSDSPSGGLRVELLWPTA